MPLYYAPISTSAHLRGPLSLCIHVAYSIVWSVLID